MAIERVVIAVDASLTALNIMTSPDMPKQVYIEDTIERLVVMVKAQLQNYIYPEFDIFYRVNNKRKCRGFKHFCGTGICSFIGFLFMNFHDFLPVSDPACVLTRLFITLWTFLSYRWQ